MLEPKTSATSLAYAYINMQWYNVSTQYSAVVHQSGTGNIVITNGAQTNQ